MFKKILLICFSLVITFQFVSAQQTTRTLIGAVIDNSNYEPVPNVNIYIANSTIGTTSDMKGNFSITGIPFETITIIFSCIGFESERTQVIFKDYKTVELKIRMKQVAYDLPTIDIVEDENNEWRINYKIFEREFLGNAAGSSKSKIENPYRINFVYSADGTLKASCQEPIIINNNMLGYKITYFLEQFVYNYPGIKFFGTAFFEENLSPDSEDAERQQQNRQISYAGSLRHFLKSISTLYLLPHPEIIAGDSIAYEDSLLTNSKKLLNRQGFTVSAATSLPKRLDKPSTSFPINTDILISPGISANELVLNFKNYLRINFNPELLDPGYKLDSKIQNSWITLEYSKAYIDLTSWSIDEYTIKTYGDWANKRVLDMLPLDYKPHFIAGAENIIY